MYSNFKHVGKEGEQLELSEGLTLLDGPNGYGKSTVFDAIELLLTGKIAHNKGKMRSLANKEKDDIIIEATLENDGEIIKLKRKFISNRYDLNEIAWNGEIISQEQLCANINFNESAMGVALYVSQLQSLSYLEKKDKEKKQMVVELIDDNEYKKSVTHLDDFCKKLNEKLSLETKALTEKKDQETLRKNILVDKINKVNNLYKKKGYIKLFEEEEYEFDKEIINRAIDYSEMIKPLEDIKDLLENYNSFKDTQKIIKIDKVLELTQAQLKSVYYSEVIDEVKQDIEVYVKIEKLENLLREKNIEEIDQINNLLPMTVDEIRAIQTVIKNYQSLKNTKKENEKYIVELVEKRKQLQSTYHNTVNGGLWQLNMCPFCGRAADDLQELFQNVEELINHNNKLVLERIQQLDEQITRYFEGCQKELSLMIEKNRKGYSQYLDMKELLHIDTTPEIKAILKEKQFRCKSSVALSNFKGDVLKLRKELEEEKDKIPVILQKERMAKYEEIIRQYYPKHVLHTIEQIDDKISYIANCYIDIYQKDLESCNSILKELEEELIIHARINERALLYAETYRDKYIATLKEYQTKLVRQIKIPLYIYSGKVIQNYPLGLGVIADIKASSIVFETQRKEDDICDYLSAGQLNGIMLSVMLAVRSVMNLDDTLNIIMIDDPLQTIDDVSAFSYADLLSEQFGDAQILLSTHEADKADLLEFKFRQHERPVTKYNMHDRYLRHK